MSDNDDLTAEFERKLNDKVIAKRRPEVQSLNAALDTHDALDLATEVFAEMVGYLSARKIQPAAFMEHHFGELPFVVRGAAWAAMNATVERHRETGWTPSASEISKFRHAVKAGELHDADQAPAASEHASAPTSEDPR